LLAIRPEEPADHDAVRSLLQAAFGPGSVEADLVDALRAADAHVPDLCLVALDDDEIVGHIFFTRARLSSSDEVLALAPMAVLPGRQREGVGSRLVEESLRLASETDFPFAIVLGHPEYYPRFGFEPAADHGVECPWKVPPEAWMAHRLPAHRSGARGLVTYPPAFDEFA
jgi:putative acetyltransferase